MYLREEKGPSPGGWSPGFHSTLLDEIFFKEGKSSLKEKNSFLEVNSSSDNSSKFLNFVCTRWSKIFAILLLLLTALVPLTLAILKDGNQISPKLFSNSSFTHHTPSLANINQNYDSLSNLTSAEAYLYMSSYPYSHRRRILDENIYGNTVCNMPFLKYICKDNSRMAPASFRLSKLYSREKLQAKNNSVISSYNNNVDRIIYIKYGEYKNQKRRKLFKSVSYAFRESDDSTHNLDENFRILKQSDSKISSRKSHTSQFEIEEGHNDSGHIKESNQWKSYKRLGYNSFNKKTRNFEQIFHLQQQNKNAATYSRKRMLRNYTSCKHERASFSTEPIRSSLPILLPKSKVIGKNESSHSEGHIKGPKTKEKIFSKKTEIPRENHRKIRSLPALVESPSKEIYFPKGDGRELKTSLTSGKRIEWKRLWPSYEGNGLLEEGSENPSLERKLSLQGKDRKISDSTFHDVIWKWHLENDEKKPKSSVTSRKEKEGPWALSSQLMGSTLRENKFSENNQHDLIKYPPTKEKKYGRMHFRKDDGVSRLNVIPVIQAMDKKNDFAFHSDKEEIYPLSEDKNIEIDSFISKRASVAISENRKIPVSVHPRLGASSKVLSPTQWNENEYQKNSSSVIRKTHHSPTRPMDSMHMILKNTKKPMKMHVVREPKRKRTERSEVNSKSKNIRMEFHHKGTSDDDGMYRGDSFLAINTHEEKSNISQGITNASQKNFPSARKFMVDGAEMKQRKETAGDEMGDERGRKESKQEHQGAHQGRFKGDGWPIASRSGLGLPSSDYRRKFRARRLKRRIDTSSVSVIEGEEAALPCDLRSADPNDAVQIILWIKEGLHTPLYSYDFRELLRGQPKETKPDANSTLSRRTSFRTDRSPAALVIERTEAEDSGVYRCRVDFLLSPTVNHRVNLTVVVPPSRVRISWYANNSTLITVSGNEVGPFVIGSQPTLLCTNEDGWPPPSVVWFEDDSVLDDSCIVDHERMLVENDLNLPPLKRNDLGRRLTCVASNTNRTSPAIMSVRINLSLRIIGVKVHTVRTLWANEEATAVCRIWGSRPRPHVVWWLGSTMLPPTDTKIEDGDANITISTLDFIPVAEDDGAMLICQATNEMLPDFAVQDSTILNVNYAPMVSVRLGRSLDPEKIKEGDDVYFECSVASKPPVTSVIWKHNGVDLVAGSGIIQSNMSLVVQGVTRDHGGSYTCHATNSRNTTASLPLHLDVKYTPVCASAQRQQHSVSKLENAEIACKVHANPSKVTFRWTFNNTAEAIDVPEGRFVVWGTESRVNYTPMNELDYGTLLCWANNSIGMQQFPCVFQIVAAGKPDPPHNCKVFDVTISSLQVSCLPGDNGGLYQTFLLQVYKVGSTSPVNEINRPTPSFSLTNLTPATSYKIVIAALNEKGASRLTELNAYTVKVPETLEETSAEPARDRDRGSSIPLALLIGTIVAVVPIIIASLVFVWLRVCRSGAKNKREIGSSGGTVDSGSNSENASNTHSSHSRGDPLSTEFPVSGLSLPKEDQNPDVVLQTTEQSRPYQMIDIATISTPSYMIAAGDKRYPPIAMASTITATDGGMHYTQIVTQGTYGIYTQSSASGQLQMPVIAASQVPYATDTIQQQQIHDNPLKTPSHQKWQNPNVIQEQRRTSESIQVTFQGEPTPKKLNSGTGHQTHGCHPMIQPFHLPRDVISKGPLSLSQFSIHRHQDDVNLSLESLSRPVTTCEITRKHSVKGIGHSRGVSRQDLSASIPSFQSMGDISQCQWEPSRRDLVDPLTASLNRNRKSKREIVKPALNTVESQSCQHLIKTLPGKLNRHDKWESAV